MHRNNTMVQPNPAYMHADKTLRNRIPISKHLNDNHSQGLHIEVARSVEHLDVLVSMKGMITQTRSMNLVDEVLNEDDREIPNAILRRQPLIR